MQGLYHMDSNSGSWPSGNLTAEDFQEMECSHNGGKRIHDGIFLMVTIIEWEGHSGNI